MVDSLVVPACLQRLVDVVGALLDGVEALSLHGVVYRERRRIHVRKSKHGEYSTAQHSTATAPTATHTLCTYRLKTGEDGNFMSEEGGKVEKALVGVEILHHIFYIIDRSPADFAS